jgi:transcriptional regulator EpsA
MLATSADSPIEDLHRFQRIAQESLTVRRHFQMLQWLQGELQHFVPHEALVAAWGDFSLGLVHYDIISSLPGVRTTDMADCDISPLICSLFNHWVTKGVSAYTTKFINGSACEIPGGKGGLHPKLRDMRTALVHGIRDERGRHDCLYVALHSRNIPVGSGKMLELLLPYIDTALRQVSHLPTQGQVDQSTETEEVLDQGLSAREMEIMSWVRKGKTNHEIGMILDISEFTVKNHLQRIFRKLNVINRAQAVSAFAQTAQNSRA